MYMCCRSIQSFVLFGHNKPSLLWLFLSTVSWLDYIVICWVVDRVVDSDPIVYAKKLATLCSPSTPNGRHIKVRKYS